MRYVDDLRSLQSPFGFMGGGVGAMPCKLGIEKLRLRVNMQKEMSVADTNLDLLRESRKDRSYR